MTAFEEAVTATGEPISYLASSRWMLRMMPPMPVRYALTSLAITENSVCWEAVEEQKKGLFGKKAEVRAFTSAALPDEAHCGCLIPEDDHFSLRIGRASLEVSHGGAREQLGQAVKALRACGVRVLFDSWMSEHAHGLGIASGRGAREAD